MCITIQKKKQPFKSQYNTSIAIQFFHCTPLYCNTIFQSPSLAIHSCILQYNFHQSSSLQYNPLPTRLGHNTLIVLQYNSNSLLTSLIAIQFPVLQYNFFSSLTSLVSIQILVLQYNYLAKTALQNYHVTIQCLYCDTISMCKWAVGHLFTAPKKNNSRLFSLFIYYFFFPILFPATGNTQKNIYQFFFFIFQNTQINL